MKVKLNADDNSVSAGAAADAATAPGVGDSSAIGAAAATSAETISFAGSGLVFNNTYGIGVSAAFKSAIISAENFFQSHFSNPVTLNMNFDLSALGNQFSAHNQYFPLHVSFDSLTAALRSHATTSDDLAAVNSLPLIDPTAGAGFSISAGMARILGLEGAGTGTDDVVILNSSMPWTYGADAVGALEHEISEGALGRIGGLGIQNSAWGPMDLFRYSSAGKRDYSGGTDGLTSYFSVDGTTMLTPFHAAESAAGVYDNQDFADWESTVRGDAFGASGPNAPGTVSATDLRVMDILGWTPTTVAAPATPSPPATVSLPTTPSVPTTPSMPTAPSQTASFQVVDATSGSTVRVTSESYTGPVSGTNYQYINITTDNLNITSSAPSSFIRTGSGSDAIDVSGAGGNNILDGSTGSNYLIGGSGDDTFYLDDRGATADVWSSIANFHSGDNATIWGITQSGFSLTWLDNQGAGNAKGLTAGFAPLAPGGQNVNITLVGFTTADLNTRLSVTYGRSPDTPGLPGSVYMNIHAV